MEDDERRRADRRPGHGHARQPGGYERITAVVVNGSYDKAGWNGTDWNWTRDQQPVSLAATAVTGGGGGPVDPVPGGGSAGGGSTGGGGRDGGRGSTGGGSTGGGSASSSTLLSVKARTLPRLAKAKVLALTAEAGAAGTFTATATVNAATAKRLGLAKRATTVGRAASRSRRAAGGRSRSASPQRRGRA